MAIPLDPSTTPPVRDDTNDQPRSERRDDQGQARTGENRWSILPRLCIVLIGGSLLARGVIWLVDFDRRGRAAHAANENFRKIVVAFQDHGEEHGRVLPAQAIYDKKTGRPLLSWRVAILPQLGEEDLYRQIRLDEPWDSAHNRQFWDRMPAAYELLGLPASGGLTAVQVFMGPETPFRDREGRKFPQGFPDGTSQTILIAEAAVPVNWMRPEDIDMNKVDPEDIRASLGDRTGKGPLIGMADGASRFLPEGVSNRVLKAAITPDGNDVLAD